MDYYARYALGTFDKNRNVNPVGSYIQGHQNSWLGQRRKLKGTATSHIQESENIVGHEVIEWPNYIQRNGAVSGFYCQVY